MIKPFTRCSVALLLFSGTTLAAETPPPAPAKAAPDNALGEVVVSGKRFSDTEERRYSTAAKMVFGREELDRYGDTSVSEVLKRLPGITVSGTPGRGGDIRMRGLGKGYTQILLNGEPVPRGFSLDSLAPEQVERIEIMRAPVAEHSARAIAGTINIVLKEEFARKSNEARPTLGWEDGRFQPGLALQRSDNLGTFNYNLAANLIHRDLPSRSTTVTTATDTRSGAPLLAQRQQDESRSTSDGVHLNARLNWKLDGGDTFSFQPFLGKWHSNSTGTSQMEQTLGAIPAPFATADWRGDSDSTMLRGMGNWKLKLADGAKLDIRFNGGQYRNDSSTDRREYAAGGGLDHTLRNTTGIRDTTFSSGGKYSRPLGQAHQMAAGWDLEYGNRSESARLTQDGVNPLARYGDNVEARTQRVAAYAQDEWDITPLWALYGGLRWEGIRTLSETALADARNQSNVLSPLFHSIWRFSEESKDQVRLGLTRSYRPPTLTNLVAMPTLAANYPASGANTATSTDSVGNPNLRPELAWGLDLAYEHYFSAGGLVSASLFRRNIDDLIRNVTSLQTVSWSPLQRWVSTPQNIGSATSHGIELEAKFRLDELVKDAPQLSVRANYSRFWSRVEDVPGPDNRLDQQPKQTANFGLDYKLRGLPLTLGGNLNWTPAYAVQQTDAQFYYQGVKRVFDVFAVWKIDPNTQLRVSAANLLHADYDTANREIFGTTDQIAQTSKTTFTSLSARLEMRF
ncbi:MAG: TonB-dependent receptor [Sulfuricella sp.]|nr:TonB-dependent receptor [Sulfuricella sp.]